GCGARPRPERADHGERPGPRGARGAAARLAAAGSTGEPRKPESTSGRGGSRRPRRQRSVRAASRHCAALRGATSATLACRLAVSSTRRPTPTQTTWRARRTRLNASPALARSPSATKSPVLAPSRTPTLPGIRNVANRTPDPTASITVAVATPAGMARTNSMAATPRGPHSHPPKRKATERQKRGPRMPIESPQALVETLGVRAVLDEPGPDEQPARPPDHAGELREQEAADEQGFDGQERDHRRDDISLDGDEHLHHQEADHQEQRLRDAAGRLGDDHRGHARLVGAGGAQEPGLHRLSADRAQRRDQVERLAGDARLEHLRVGGRLVGEGEAPPQGIDGHDETV